LKQNHDFVTPVVCIIALSASKYTVESVTLFITLLTWYLWEKYEAMHYLDLASIRERLWSFLLNWHIKPMKRNSWF